MEPEKKSNGAFVGLVVIIIILIIGGIYMWQSNKNTLGGKQGSADSEAITGQDYADLDTLQMEAQTVDTTTGVDANAVN